MKIKSIDVFVCCPGRNFVTVKITTDSGIYGLGDATLNGRELAVVTYLEEHVTPCLIGRDPHAIEDIWHYLYRGGYWRAGAVTMAAISAIDLALWDIKGKVAGLPVYQLLGGKSRRAVGLYAHASGVDTAATLAAARDLISAGFTAIRLQTAIPGLATTYGVLDQAANYEELQGNRPLPPEEIWSTPKYFNMIDGLFRTARSQLGEEVQLLHDVHNRLTPVEAARLGKLLEPYHLLFLEDPSSTANPDGYRLIRQHTTTPLAAGETHNTPQDYKSLIEGQLIDYVRTAATHAGGITAMRRIADYAAMHNVQTAPHGAPDLSPICFAAHIHLGIWAPNFGIQEFVGLGNAQTREIFRHDIRVRDGAAVPSEAPGLGVVFDETAAQAYPYKRSYLPVSRLEDGTLWHW